MWASQYTYICGRHSTHIYVGVTVHIYMWASQYTYIRGRHGTHIYVGVTVHIHMWASWYTYEMRGRHSTHIYVGVMVHIDAWAAWHTHTHICTYVHRYVATCVVCVHTVHTVHAYIHTYCRKELKQVQNNTYVCVVEDHYNKEYVCDPVTVL